MRVPYGIFPVMAALAIAKSPAFFIIIWNKSIDFESDGLQNAPVSVFTIRCVLEFEIYALNRL